jgi:hypothetical protein
MIRSLFVILFFFYTSLHGEESKYQLGQGIQVGELPLFVGGYFSLEYEHAHGKNRALTLDELAIMAYGEYNNFSYMLELEAEDVYNEAFGNETSEEVNKEIHIERLYVNYEFNENYALKLGKFNSPIGFWNRIPINVLRDTSSSPSVTTLLFPRFTSGADLLYQTENAYEITVDTIMQGGEDLDKALNNEIYNNFDADGHYGFGISMQKDAWNYQFNTGYFHLTLDEEYYYLLGAVKYEQYDFKLQGELGSQFNDEGSTIPYVGYFQGSYMINDNHQAIVRLEAYKDQLTNTKDSFAVIGYTYRPLYPIAFKGEYQWHSLHDENKMLLSISVLF